MKVVFVLPGYSRVPIGGYKIVFDYAENLARYPDVSVHVIYHPTLIDLPSSGYAIRQAARARQTIKALGTRITSGRNLRWRSLDPRIRTHLSMSAATKLALDEGDVVIATAAQTAFAAARVVAESGARGFYFLQHVEDWLVDAAYLHRTYELPLEKIAVAPWIRDYCVRNGFSPCSLVLNAVDSNKFSPGAPLSQRPYVGTLLAPGNPRKGTTVAVQVLNRIAELGIPTQSFGTCKRPSDLSFLVEHYDDPSPSSLQEFYHRSRVFFCASRTEGFGLAPAEAALSGAVVVSTRNGGVEAYGRGFVEFCGYSANDLTDTVRIAYAIPAELQPKVREGILSLSGYTPATAANRFAKVIFAAPPVVQT